MPPNLDAVYLQHHIGIHERPCCGGYIQYPCSRANGALPTEPQRTTSSPILYRYLTRFDPTPTMYFYVPVSCLVQPHTQIPGSHVIQLDARVPESVSHGIGRARINKRRPCRRFNQRAGYANKMRSRRIQYSGTVELAAILCAGGPRAP